MIISYSDFLGHLFLHFSYNRLKIVSIRFISCSENAKGVRPFCICFTVYAVLVFIQRCPSLCARACSAATATWASRAECMTKEPRLNLSPPTKLRSAAPPTGGGGHGQRDLRGYGTSYSFCRIFYHNSALCASVNSFRAIDRSAAFRAS